MIWRVLAFVVFKNIPRYFSPENPAQGFWKFDGRMDLGKHETAREAIDAARE